MSFGYQAIPLEGVQIFHGVGVDEPSPDQFHAELELGWVQQGKVRLQPARSDEPGPIAAAGEAVLIGPGVAHSVEVVERCTFLVAYVHPDLARRLLGAAHLRGVLVFPATQPLQAALHELVGARDPGSARSALERVASLLPTVEGPATRPRPAELERARAHLSRHLARPCDLDELADVAGLSRWHLSRSFAAHYGLPPRAYHRHLRLEAARASLSAGTSVGEVADLLGFADTAHLSRAFRRTFKVTPSQYRADTPARPTSNSPKPNRGRT